MTRRVDGASRSTETEAERRPDGRMSADARADAASVAPGHAVQFFEDPVFLVDAVAAFCAEGLRQGRPVLAFSEASRIDGLTSRLRARGVDLDDARRSGRLSFVDARATLTEIMGEAGPLPERFRARVGGAIAGSADSAPQHRTPRIHGDMVDLLCREGNPDAALRLETLWNELAAERGFELLCAYDLAHFRDERDAGRFRAVCDRHAAVLPAEGYARLAGEEERRSEVVRLQQRARALRTEIDRRKRLESSLRRALEAERRAREKSEEASRQQEEFLALLSHELRTPLSAILGWSHVMSELRCDEATVRRALEAIQRNARRQVHLIDDLLDASRIATGTIRLRKRPVELGELVRRVADAARPAAEAEGIDLRVSAEPAPPIEADPARLRQVASALLANAIKFTPEGGRVALRLERGPGEARIVVADTGQGIAAEFLPRVFDRFRQADTGPARCHGGLGLGLAVARHLVEAHGGTIEAASPGPDAGATFTVRLPLDDEAREG